MITLPGTRRRREREDAVERVLSEVRTWPGVTTAPHPFDAVEIQLGALEFGHMHRSGVLDIPFVRRLRNAVVDAGQASAHRWIPNSGWVTFEIRTAGDAAAALRLLRLSYLYRSIVAGGGELGYAAIEDELAVLDLEPRVREVFASILARRRAAADGDDATTPGPGAHVTA